MMKKIFLIALFSSLLLVTNFAEAALYLGKPYVSHPLGDGENAPYTKGPLYRLDGFDCVTYVETFLAEKRAALGGDFDESMMLIRYLDGEVGFFTRAHFTENQWIPNAEKHGFIERYPLPGEVQSYLEVEHSVWFLENPTVQGIDENFTRRANSYPKFKASIAYIPREKIDANLLRTLNEEMVVFILREFKKPFLPGQVGAAVFATHMGLLLDRTQFYHASSGKKKEVVSLPLLQYLKENKSVKGAAFYKIL